MRQMRWGVRCNWRGHRYESKVATSYPTAAELRGIVIKRICHTFTSEGVISRSAFKSLFIGVENLYVCYNTYRTDVARKTNLKIEGIIIHYD